MSTTVDQKVVEMRFDNRHFENNVSTTLASLDKLKQGLNLKGATKGLEDVGQAAKGVNLSGLTNAVETVQARFSALSVMGVTALTNITNSAVNAGKRIASALTIDPIKTGFSEYETKMGAIQTIMSNTASKGTTMQDVTNVLNELNLYADKTIYNFAEMTRNIGTFTAAGVGLKESASAIQGIANLAAASGSTSQQASTAMYQLSQALASGTVKLMDWNSVVNAGMGGQKFQDALKATAKEHGKNVDGLIKKYGSFRETLQSGWLTADILNETLSKFTVEGAKSYSKSMMEAGKWTQEQADALVKEAQAMEDAATKVKTFSQLWETLKEGAQSGWAQTWEIVVGDFEEAKATLTEISDVIGGMLGESANRRNDLLGGALSTGWKQLLGEGIDDAVGFQETVEKVAKDHGVKLDEMINDETTFQDTLKEGWLTSDMITESVGKFTDELSGMSEKELEAAGYTQKTVEKMKELRKGLENGSISAEEFAKKMARPSGRELLIESLWNAFRGVLSVIEPIKEAFRDIFPAMESEQLYQIIETIKEFSEKLKLSDEASENLKRTFKGIFSVVDIVRQAFVAVIKAIAPLFGGLDDLGGGILSVTAKWGDWLVELDNTIKISGALETFVDRVHAGFEKIKSFLEPVANGLKSFVNEIKVTLTDAAFNATERLSPLAAIGNFIKNIFVGLGKIIQKIAPFIYSAAAGIGNVLKELMNRISDSMQNASYDKLFDLTSGGIMTAIGVFIAKFMKSGSDLLDNASGFVENIKSILDGVGDALGAFTQSLKAEALKKIATAIGILAASLLVLSLIDSEKLTLSLVTVTTLFGELMLAMSVFSKISDTKGLTKVSVSLIALSSALLILSIALKIMSTMTWEEMGIGLISMVVGLGALVGAVNLLPDGKVNKAAKAIKKLSTALVILAIGIKILSTMTWEEMGIGLIAMVAGLGALVGAVNLLPKDTAMRAAGMVGLATAMVILSAALKIMATMSWDDIARSLVTLAGSLGILAGAMAIMKKGISGAAAMMVIAPALVVLASALKIMATMSWDDILRGLVTLAGSLITIAGAMAVMRNALPGAAALLIVSAALMIFTPALMLMGSMSWESIAKGLITIAGAFAIMGVAAVVLQSLTPTILALSAALTLFGVACIAVGVGVAALGLGLTAIAAAGGAAGVALTSIVAGLIALIPYVIEQIGIGIINLCKVISGGAAAICEAVTVIILAVVDALVASVPAIVEGVFVLITELLKTLVEYTPTIVKSLFDFLIGILNAIAEKLPDLIQAGVNVLMAFFAGVVEALKSIDPTVLVNGLMAIGVLTALVGALAAIAVLTPVAMIGVLGLGAVITELALVLAGIGALAQIPGLQWLVNEGAEFMSSIGRAIGKFLGSIIGGFGEGISGSLPQIGADLSAFMNNAKTFFEGAKSIDSSSLDGVKSIVGIIAALTAVDIMDGLTSWLTGGSSLTKFGEEIASFGPNIKAYADAVSGIDEGAVVASANAAKALSEMASNIPNEGGMVSWFTGENSISKFGSELVVLGASLRAYSFAVAGIDSNAIIESANAAKALTEMASSIPDEGGMVTWFTGDNSIAKFGPDLVLLGQGLKGYSDAIAGFDPEAVIASANAAKAITDMAASIPDEGGVGSWFAGDNSISAFGGNLVELGKGMKAFSDSIVGFDPEAVVAAANATKAITDMAASIPDEGGVGSWFAGDNSISTFGPNLVVLGTNLKAFSDSIVGFDPEAVVAAANAAKAITDMAASIPDEGGVGAWFAGDNSISTFAANLAPLGAGLKSFSDSVEGIVPENITAAVTAAQSIVDMSKTIPDEGGVGAWFAGDNSLATFAGHLDPLGKGLKSFSDSVEGIVPENVTAAVTAAKAIVDMSKVIPDEGGIGAWFGGDNSMSVFAGHLAPLGAGLKSFSDSVEGIVPENIVAAANAAKALAQMASVIPDEGGIGAWFAGDNSVSTFASHLEPLGKGLKAFSDSVEGISSDNISAATIATRALIGLANAAPSDSSNLHVFGMNLLIFGENLKVYFNKMSGITAENISTSSNVIKSVKNATSGLQPGVLVQAANAIEEMVRAVSKMAQVNAGAADNFSAAIKKLADTNVESMLNSFKNAGSSMKDAGKTLLDKFISGIEGEHSKVKTAGEATIDKLIDGVEGKRSKAVTAFTDLVKACARAIAEMAGSFKTAATDLVRGFANGISANTYMAKAKARAMASAAAQAARDELDEHSPSRVGYEIGDFFGIAVVNGVSDNIDKSYAAGKNIAASAKNGLVKGLTKLNDIVSNNIDTQPTIRPVLDLSRVRAGAGAISSMFGSGTSVGVLSNVSSISSMMDRRSQNGVNGEVVSAIDNLGKKMDHMGNTTYSINGISVNEGSDVSEAIKVIVRQAIIEGRV